MFLKFSKISQENTNFGVPFWTPTQVFSCKYCKIFKSSYVEKHLRMAGSANINDLEQSAFRILSSITYEAVKRQREEKQKSIVSGQFFIFRFWIFWGFRNTFWYQVKQMILNSYQYFRSYTILQNYDTVLSLSSQCRCTRHIIWHISITAHNFIDQKVWEFWVIWTL